MEDKIDTSPWGIFDRMYSLCINSTDEQEFFVNLGLYLRYFINKSALWRPFDIVYRREVLAQNNQKYKLGKKVIEESIKSFNKLCNIIKEKKIKINGYLDVKKSIDEYRLFLKGGMYISGDNVSNHVGQLNLILVRISQHKELAELVEGFIKKNKDNTFGSYKTSPSVFKYDEEVNKIERIEQSNLPYIWERLSYYYQILFKQEESWANALKEKLGFFALSGIGASHMEITNTIKRTKVDNSIRIFGYKEYERIVRRFHVFVFTALNDENCFVDDEPNNPGLLSQYPSGFGWKDRDKCIFLFNNKEDIRSGITGDIFKSIMDQAGNSERIISRKIIIESLVLDKDKYGNKEKGFNQKIRHLTDQLIKNLNTKYNSIGFRIDSLDSKKGLYKVIF